MRPSPHRHTLAVLRTFLGLTQKEMADLIECSRPTIQAIELCKLPLSDKLANRMHFETGIGLGWLLGGDPSAPMTGFDGRPYAKADFEGRQALNDRRTSDALDPDFVEGVLSSALIDIQTMLLEAYESKKLELCAFKLRQALQQLRKELGIKNDSKFTFGDPEYFDHPERWPKRPQRMSVQLKELVEEFEKHFQKLYKQKPKPRP